MLCSELAHRRGDAAALQPSGRHAPGAGSRAPPAPPPPVPARHNRPVYVEAVPGRPRRRCLQAIQASPSTSTCPPACAPISSVPPLCISTLTQARQWQGSHGIASACLPWPFAQSFPSRPACLPALCIGPLPPPLPPQVVTQVVSGGQTITAQQLGQYL